jgi:hypothetical protein
LPGVAYVARVVNGARKHQNSCVPPESWEPSWQLCALEALRSVLTLGCACAMLWFFFPRVLLPPGMILVGLSCLARCLLPARVRLDRARGELAITFGWTHHVPLSRIERVDEVLRFGAVITTRESWQYRFSPFRKRRRVERWLRIRSGFEGMDLAVEAARADDPSWSADHPRFPVGVGPASLICGLGALMLALAALVRPQAGGWLVHAAADLLTLWYGIGGAVIGLIGGWLLLAAVTRAVSVRRSRLGPGLR